MGYRFFAVPSHHLAPSPAPFPKDGLLTLELPHHPEEVELALTGAEFRDAAAPTWLRGLLTGEASPPYGPPGPGCGRSAVVAKPPQDLPALLRLADQLDHLIVREAGERARVWVCSCGKRYAVPLAFARSVTLPCDGCGEPLELTLATCQGEEQLLDPLQAAVNSRRRKLATFFREAMARGWPVLACTTDE